MNRLTSLAALVALGLLLVPNAARAVPCACDGDVDNNGVVDINDGVCITECRNGICSCCVSSCDVNCDGVVDAGDVGDNATVDPSAWLCLFQGGIAADCCPGPTGACCQTDTGACTEAVTEGNCSAANQIWNSGLSCVVAACPAAPVGACCNVGNGHCLDSVVAPACTGPDDVWTQATACVNAACAVPPQVPCTCDADVDNSGIVDLADALCITNCRNGDCSCCVSSCDVNCDGIVDVGDVGNNVSVDPSTWLCRFQGGAPATCCAGPTGACCQTDTGACTENTFEGSCIGANRIWNSGLSCAAAACPAAPVGACCNVGNGQCQESLIAADCAGPDDVWTQATACADAACAVPPQVPCTCDADVNNDGIVNLTDAVCITNCRNGDCSCCVSSCDVNCDGVVDAGDAGNDIAVDPSAWLCLFQGGIAADCCPGPTGACCQTDTGACTEAVSQGNCSAANQIWNSGLSCVAAACPAAPVGACCNVGNGHCLDSVVAPNCTGPDDVWTEATACVDAACAVPPQVPCTCDADVDSSGIVDLADALCITNCRNGDCSCCVSSCDVNCDGIVDAGDVGDNVSVDPSTWLCRFQGVAPASCCTGPTGACCQTDTGACTENTFEGSCIGANRIWNSGLSCAAAACPAAPVGACCNTGNGQCREFVVAAVCTGPDDVWTQATACVDAGCSVPPQVPCTCDGDVDNDGVVNLIDWLCIHECKLGDCSCCVSSCDVNCDGVVDVMDAGVDPVTESSTWECLFTGQQPAFCCSAEFQDTLIRLAGIPTVSEWGLVAMTLLLLVAGTVMLRSRLSRVSAGH